MNPNLRIGNKEDNMAGRLIDERINDYVEALSSGAPTPGGGAVAALTAAQGAALIMMVANLTVGKKKYAEFEELNVAAIEEAKGYLDQLMAGVDEDKFGQVASAYGMPKETDEEKVARSEAIAIASVGAAEAPLKVMRAGTCALRLADSLIDRSNKQLVSDLYVAALNLNAGVQAAEFNVSANVPYIPDRELAESWKKESEKLSEEANTVSIKILCSKK